MPRFFISAAITVASFCAASLMILKAARFAREVQETFGQIDFVRENMATSEKVAALAASVTTLVSNVGTLGDVVTQETQQSADVLAELRSQVNSGADEETLTSLITQVEESNARVVDATSRVQSIVPDTQAAVSDVAESASTPASDGTTTDANTTAPETAPSESQFAAATA